jgi:hypothetical protein
MNLQQPYTYQPTAALSHRRTHTGRQQQKRMEADKQAQLPRSQMPWQAAYGQLPRSQMPWQAAYGQPICCLV